MRLLAIDTAGERGSAALWLEGAISASEADRDGAAAALILGLVDALLGEAGVRLGTLDAIAFGRGPGAFTGVRLAASLAQGLAFGAGLPVLPVSDLQALAQQALDQHGAPAHVVIAQDARMGEVYWGCFERQGTRAAAVGPEAVGAPATLRLPAAWQGVPLCAAGSGFQAYPTLRAQVPDAAERVWSLLRPRAQEIAMLAAHAGLAAAVPPEQGLPVYLRDEVAVLPSSN